MRQEKQFSFKYILVSALYIVLGLVLLFWPALSVKTICYVLSAIMFVIGIAYIIMNFIRDKDESNDGFLQMDLVIGIVAAAFGAFVLFNQQSVATMLPFVMGIVFLLGALIKVQNALTMRKLKFQRWYVVLIFACIIAGLGAITLANPFSTEHNLLVFIGICLIMDGLVNLISMAMIVSRMKKLRKMQRKYPDRTITPDDLIAARKPRAFLPGHVQDPQREPHVVDEQQPPFEEEDL